MRSDPSPFQRRSPKQARSRATVEAIVEAAAQILERDGPEALNTNDVAERAGVSIGTLYQYFPDKQAVLLAAARRELSPLAGRQKALAHALINIIERLGGQGLRVAKGGSAKRGAAPSPRRRGPAWDSRWSHLLERLADALAPLPAPELKPIRVEARRRHSTPLP